MSQVVICRLTLQHNGRTEGRYLGKVFCLLVFFVDRLFYFTFTSFLYFIQVWPLLYTYLIFTSISSSSTGTPTTVRTPCLWDLNLCVLNHFCLLCLLLSPELLFLLQNFFTNFYKVLWLSCFLFYNLRLGLNPHAFERSRILSMSEV